MNQTPDSNSNFNKPFYAKTFKNNVKDIIKIKDIFPKILVNKVNKINNVINKSSQKSKSKLNITIKNSYRKQIIILISINIKNFN